MRILITHGVIMEHIQRVLPFAYDDKARDFEYQSQLAKVCTMKEVCAMWCKDAKEVKRNIYLGLIYGEKRDAPEHALHGRWLIAYQSCVALWGNPKDT